MKWILLLAAAPMVVLGWHYGHTHLSVIGLILLTAFLVMT